MQLLDGIMVLEIGDVLYNSNLDNRNPVAPTKKIKIKRVTVTTAISDTGIIINRRSRDNNYGFKDKDSQSYDVYHLPTLNVEELYKQHIESTKAKRIRVDKIQKLREYYWADLPDEKLDAVIAILSK